MVRAGRLYKRHEVKPGGTPPPAFELADHDEVTGKRQGWLPVGEGPEDRWHREAWGHYVGGEQVGPPDGTYELLGPKVQGNPEGYARHTLVPHGDIEVDAPRTFAELREWLDGRDVEGVVFRHPDGRMAKIKAKDMGFRRPTKPSKA